MATSAAPWLDSPGTRSVYSVVMNRQTAFSALAFLSTLLLGCDSANNPLAPSGTVLTITAVPSQIPLSGEGSRVTVIGVKPDGNPINPGTQVTFIASLGVLRPVSGSCADSAVVDVVEADDRGRTSALLCGDGRSGEAMVTATLTSAGGGSGGGEGGGGATGASASVTVQIGETDASRPTLIISANPTVVPVGGCSRITLIGRAADGTPVPAGQRIRLTANLGSLICPAVSGDNCPGAAPASSCSEVFTDANGEAEVTFRAGDRADPSANVTAILGTAESVSATITIRDAPSDFSFQASPRRVTASAGAADITLTVEVLNAQGVPIGGVSVIFETDIGGTFASGSGRQTTNPSGQATDTLTVPQRELEAETVPNGGDGFFNVSARVIGEGIELGPTTLRINVDP